ncbi:MAG: cofactor-independent phosphoglycerate mutase [Phycisphaerae bacterium]|nr:cofactor-independent phosphoglycerate mutase [Phycisphaerae bacterium]
MSSKCKYVIIVPDGAADEPLEEFGGQTILEAADTPNMDKIAAEGRLGMVKTIPDGFEPGSDIAQMSLLGYDPTRYYTGRAPIEAAAMGIELADTDWVFRCNLVTISDGVMEDHSAGHISTEEGCALIKMLNEQFGSNMVRFYPGVSYRHLLIIKGHEFDVQTYPPHDHIGVASENILPRGKGAEMLIDLMARSQQLFGNCEINRIRRDLSENQVTSIWLWGEGKKTVMDSFEKKYGINGAAITAVDLVRGLGRLIGFKLINVPGATGFVDTNYEGKAEAALKALEDNDLVLVHVEGPDEAGHSGNAAMKKKAVERIDKKIIGPVLEGLQLFDEYRILVMPDHPTPVHSKAHSGDPVPFAIYGTGIKSVTEKPFTEAEAKKTGLFIENGCDLMEYFLKR